jgi:pyruvyl transferase EpsO
LTNQQLLEKLKQKLPLILDQFDRTARCIYVDYPVHPNVGDLLINLGSECFFAEHNVPIWRRYNIHDFPPKVSGIDDSVVFLHHGGGNLGDLYPEHQVLRERILRQYPKNRMIFLPQTAFYKSAEEERKSVEAMARHRNLHVFVRDKDSLSRLAGRGLPHVSVMPDMAHFLAGTLHPICGTTEVDSLILLRKDEEAGCLPANLGGARPSVDWNKMVPLPHKVLWRIAHMLISKAGLLGEPLKLARLWYWNREILIRDSLCFFSPFETVITNRLHAMILGLLLNKQVVWFDNSYGKLSSYVDAWLLESPNVRSGSAEHELAGQVAQPFLPAGHSR